MDRKEQARIRKQRQRDKERQESVTFKERDRGSVTGHLAILDALVDPVKRSKLEKISRSLKDFNVSQEVRYGVCGPTFNTVGELLEIT